MAAAPGGSNHESGRAIDVGNWSAWVTILGDHGWAHDVPGDDVHFDHLASPDLRDWGYAGGGALTLRLALFRAPLALRYQASRTWLDDRWSTTQVLTLGADL